MQAPTRKSTPERLTQPRIHLELPEPLRGRAQEMLGHLIELAVLIEIPGSASRDTHLADPDVVRVFAGTDGWYIVGSRVSEQPLTENDVLLRVQELLVESAARRRNQILFRGSVVVRGSQSVLIVGDVHSTHVALAVALTSLEFRYVSIGMAAFDACQPEPQPLFFRLDAQEREALQSLPHAFEQKLERLSPDLFRPCAVAAAREPTHILFPEARPGRLTVVRPISAAMAQSRLCSALAVAPDDPPRFVDVAEVLRHARGVHLTLGDLSGAVSQLARLLPRWCVEQADDPSSSLLSE